MLVFFTKWFGLSRLICVFCFKLHVLVSPSVLLQSWFSALSEWIADCSNGCSSCTFDVTSSCSRGSMTLTECAKFLARLSACLVRYLQEIGLFLSDIGDLLVERCLPFRPCHRACSAHVFLTESTLAASLDSGHFAWDESRVTCGRRLQACQRCSKHIYQSFIFCEIIQTYKSKLNALWNKNEL